MLQTMAPITWGCSQMDMNKTEEDKKLVCPKCNLETLEWDYDDEAGYGEVWCTNCKFWKVLD